jgi:UDP-glucose 4-epimerase
MRAMGWKPRYSIRESVVKTVQYLAKNQWLLTSREAGQKIGT